MHYHERASVCPVASSVLVQVSLEALTMPLNHSYNAFKPLDLTELLSLK